jgi:hypothetical protein
LCGYDEQPEDEGNEKNMPQPVQKLAATITAPGDASLSDL